MSKAATEMRTGDEPEPPASGSCPIVAPAALVCPSRLLFLALLLGFAFFGLGARLYYLQIVRHDEVAPRARNLMRSYIDVPGRRGDILSSGRDVLARSLTGFELGLDPALISEENRAKSIEFLCRSVGLSDEERRRIVDRYKEKLTLAAQGRGPEPRYLPLHRKVSDGLVQEITSALEQLLPASERRAVIFTPRQERQYPAGSLLGTELGAVTDGTGGVAQGIAGLEMFLDQQLAGRNGKLFLTTEGRRKERWFVPGEVDVAPVHGYHAVLTIDSQIQAFAQEELEKAIEKEKAAAGAVLVMECQTGNLLAMVSLPSLNPNRFHDYPPDEFRERRKIRPIENEYEPGSTIKPFLAAMALERKLFRPDQRVWDGGRVHVFNNCRRVEDVSDHGPMDFSEAVIYSSNIGMAHVGLRLGRDGLIGMLDGFRFQRETGLGIPGEASGYRTQRARWTENYTTISVSFGYEVRVTPIQLCAAFNSVVNGGYWRRPTILDRLERDDESVEIARPEPVRTISAETSRQMREILTQVVERGTAKMVRIPGFSFGGKTGTAEVAGRGGYVAREYISSFVAFAPSEEPRLVVLALVEKPRVHHYGSTVAGPIVQGILKRVFRPEPPDPATSASGGGKASAKTTQATARAPERPVARVAKAVRTSQ